MLNATQSTDTSSDTQAPRASSVRRAALSQLRQAIQLLEVVADCVAPHVRQPPSWSAPHEAIVTGRVEGRFRLGLRIADLTAVLIGRDGRVMTRCPLDGIPGGLAGQTLLRGIQGHFGLHGHTLTRAPAGTFQCAPITRTLSGGGCPVELARCALG